MASVDREKADEILWNLVESMKTADTAKADYAPQQFANTLALALEGMPRMSAKHLCLLTEALYAAYKLGQNRQNILDEREGR